MISSHILLTGGNGFIGSHILSQLLDLKFNVLCTVRSQAKGNNILADFSSRKSQIKISVVPDIAVPEAYDCTLQENPLLEAVIHTASPFAYGAVEDNLEFLDPAINGATNLLKSVKEYAPNVKRVVLTSSCAAVIDYDRLTSDQPLVYNEENWNPITWEEALHGEPSKAYRASKKFAELAAWKFIKEESPKFDLVTLCPPATFGPLNHSISSIKDLNESNARLWKFCFASTIEAPMPYIPVHTYVDVRDLATAHVRAALKPSASNQRFIVCARQFSFQGICDILRSNFPELNTRTPLGKPGTSSLPEGAYDIDNSKVRKGLGMEFRGLEETVVDVARQLLDLETSERKDV